MSLFFYICLCYIVICLYIVFYYKKEISKFTTKYKNIFIYWEQGWDNAPLVCKYCLESWKKYNKETWNIIQLEKSNLRKYIDIEKFVPNFWQIPIASRSDILRINLLKKYNGLWVDATLFCTKPLDSWLKKYDTFFAFSNPIKGRKIASWFLYSKKPNYIVNRYCDKYNLYWKDKIRPENYYQFHIIFNELYESDTKFRYLWDSILPKIEANISHKLKFPLKYESLPYEKQMHIKFRKSPCYKLDHHPRSSIMFKDDNNVYSYLAHTHFSKKIVHDMNTSNVKICILIISAPNLDDRWKREKELWYKYMNSNPNIDCYFIECNENQEYNDNILVTKCKESIYPGIILKTINSLKTVRNKYDFYIRTNLSTFFIFENLLNMLKTIDQREILYTGSFMFNNKYKACINKKITYIQGTTIIMNNKGNNYLLDNVHLQENMFDKCHDDIIIGLVFENMKIHIKKRLFAYDNSLSIKENVNYIEKNKIPYVRIKKINDFENAEKLNKYFNKDN